MILDPIKLLIVEDDKITLEYLEKMAVWKDLGIEVAATAINGKQGFVKYHSCRPNLVLSDVEMPFLNGLEMFREIRRDDPSVVLLVISSYSEFSYVKDAMQLGAWAYLLKNEMSEEAVHTTIAPIAARIRDMTAAAETTILKELQTVLSEETGMEETTASLARSFRVLRTHGGAQMAQRLQEQASRILQKAFSSIGRPTDFSPCYAVTFAELQPWIMGQVQLLHDRKRKDQPDLSPTVANCLRFIQSNYADKNLSIDQIAQSVYVSPNWLSAKFKSEFGCTINEYITQFRIDKAKNLLISGQYKIYEVAEMVGYGSSRYFSRVFSKLTNQTPQNYRGD